MIEKDIQNIKDNYESVQFEIKSIRKRLHNAENNIASNFGILAETKANAEWVMSSLEKTTKRVNEFADTIETKISYLIARMESYEKRFMESQIKTMEEKISSLNKFKSLVFSKNALIFILALVYLGDKINIVSNFELMKRIIGW